MRLFLVLLILLVAKFCFADTYIITKPDKSVYSLSNEDDAVLPDGYTKTIVKDKLPQDFQLSSDITLYDYKNKNFVLNTQMVHDKQQKELAEASKVQEKINKKKDAIEKLKGLGLKEDEIEALFN